MHSDRTTLLILGLFSLSTTRLEDVKRRRAKVAAARALASKRKRETLVLKPSPLAVTI